MKRALFIGFFLVAAVSAYQVHELIDEEDEESARGKRQESGGAYIDSIFNIPIVAIKQTSQAAQTLSPTNAATIESVLKIPVTTLQAVSALIKNRQQQQQLQAQQQQSSTRPTTIRREDVVEQQPQEDEVSRTTRRREELRRRMEAARERQRVWEEQLHRRRMDQLERYTRRMQQRISSEDERENYYKDPFGFSAVSRWIVGHPHRVAIAAAARRSGHGDGHVYQYYNRDKPLHFGGRQSQDIYQPTSTAGPVSSSSSTPGSSSTTAATTTTTAATSSTTAANRNVYAVRELIDEGSNPFAWPNWFGIIVRKPDVEPQKEDDYYKYKYAQQKKTSQATEQELTGNELDADVANSAELGPAPREGRVLFPTD